MNPRVFQNIFCISYVIVFTYIYANLIMHVYNHISNTPKLKSHIETIQQKQPSMINTPNYDELLYDIETNFTPLNNDSNIRMHYTTMLLLMAE
jgi:hypothetical protein